MGSRIAASVAFVGVLLSCLDASRPAERAIAAEPARTPLEAVHRRPVAGALSDDGKWLFVANQRSGTVSVIDAASRKVEGEVRVGRKLSDLAIAPDGKRLVVVDEEAGEIVAFRLQGSTMDKPIRLAVGSSPANVQLSADGDRAVVALQWPRRLAVVDLGTAPRVLKTIDLTFAPRAQLLLSESHKVIVADAFGGRIAVVDVNAGKLESDRQLPVHNIRGLALSTDRTRLLVSHQVLNSSRGSTSRDDVHWGNLITNGLRELQLTSLLDPKADLLRRSRLHRLGEVGRGAGDPAGVTTLPGKWIVALAGVDEVGIRDAETGSWHRIAVGRRPTTAIPGPDDRAYVMNTLDDSVSVLDLKTNKVVAEIPLGPQVKSNVVDRGESLFHDARLSHDGWFSCHSCHTDGHSNGRLADTLGDGSHGTPRRVLTLLGVKDTGPWAWNGGMRELDAQVRKSVATTMQGAGLTTVQEGELVAYMKTLSPPPALARARKTMDEAVVRRGREVFEGQGCANCHVPPTYSSSKTYDVGSGEEGGNQSFNPPSLRGVSQAGPYFHNGRAATLEQVVTKHRHQLKTDLTKENVSDLLAFLESL